MGIATMIGPGLFAGTFAYFIGEAARVHLPGAAFVLASLLLAVGALVAARVTSRVTSSVASRVSARE
jgi:DHA1 family tetracycline resistance protein-like MFS transporter